MCLGIFQFILFVSHYTIWPPILSLKEVEFICATFLRRISYRWIISRKVSAPRALTSGHVSFDA